MLNGVGVLTFLTGIFKFFTPALVVLGIWPSILSPQDIWGEVDTWWYHLVSSGRNIFPWLCFKCKHMQTSSKMSDVSLTLTLLKRTITDMFGCLALSSTSKGNASLGLTATFVPSHPIHYFLSSHPWNAMVYALKSLLRHERTWPLDQFAFCLGLIGLMVVGDVVVTNPDHKVSWI